MSDVWADEEDEDFFDYYGEAIEVTDQERKKIKMTDVEPGKEPKIKKIVQNPRPKLDTEKLLDDQRGLPELLRMAANLHFRDGHEIEDMRTSLSVIELWSHRLFPKYTYDDFLIKCEKLGKKRPIKTMLRKTRTGLL